MLKIYGTPLCPDCVQCVEDLAAAGVEFEYLNISENLRYLKELLKHRDSNVLFDDLRAAGKIGIPCIEREDGSITLEWDEFLK